MKLGRGAIITIKDKVWKIIEIVDLTLTNCLKEEMLYFREYTNWN